MKVMMVAVDYLLLSRCRMEGEEDIEMLKSKIYWRGCSSRWLMIQMTVIQCPSLLEGNLN